MFFFQSEPLLQQAKTLLSDTGSVLVVSVESFRKKRTEKVEVYEKVSRIQG